MVKTQNPYWSENVKTHYHTPTGLFTQKAQQVVEGLMSEAQGDPVLALRRLVFYMNRAGENLENFQQLKIAKEQIENVIKTRNS